MGNVRLKGNGLNTAYTLDPSGMWLTVATRRLSPNYDERPKGMAIDLLVVHSISLPPGEFGNGYIDQLFLNKLDPAHHPYFQQIAPLSVSAHVLIDRSGAVTQYVPLTHRAWHAGTSFFAGRKRCNDYSIGIELEGSDDIDFTDAQYAVLAALTQAIMAHYPLITPQRIVGHSDIAPERKRDPGERFDWRRFFGLL